MLTKRDRVLETRTVSETTCNETIFTIGLIDDTKEELSSVDICGHKNITELINTYPKHSKIKH